MSATLQWKLHTPRGHGWTICSDSEEHTQPKTYAWIAYTDPECDDTWFAAQATTVQRLARGNWVHAGLISLGKGKELPFKSDLNVFAIPPWEARRLHVLELFWWSDHDAHFAVYRDETEARKYAHQRVQERKGQDLNENGPAESASDYQPSELDYGSEDDRSDDGDGADQPWRQELNLDAGDDADDEGALSDIGLGDEESEVDGEEEGNWSVEDEQDPFGSESEDDRSGTDEDGSGVGAA